MERRSAPSYHPPSTTLSKIVAAIPWKPLLQRLPGTLLIFLFPFAIWGPIYLPALFAIYYTSLHILFLINNSRSAYGMYVSYNSSKLSSVTNWVEKYCAETGTSNGSDTRHDLPFDLISHIIILPNYKEDMDTLYETLEVLASHDRALTQYRICLAMEEGEQGCADKAQKLIKKFGSRFADITYTVHPLGIPGEIRGKSSNVAWAAKEMAQRGGSFHSHEIVTVMDADSAFADDYFMSISYHYAVASPEQRKIMMFAPSTVFDRNAANVPVFVRVTDMFWSIGVMSNLYSSSPVKIPCSAYSVSMDLCTAVNFWDAGPEAIGEDLHMYLKCFFATQGKLIVKSIFSPASQCNVEGNGAPGIRGYLSGLKARYVQAKRHLWGSLDTTYSIRRTILGIFAPQATNEPVIHLKNVHVNKLGKEVPRIIPYDFTTMFVLFHRLLESHILMGHMFLMIIIASIMLPVSSSISFELATFCWGFLSDTPVHPYVSFALQASFWIRFACLFPNICMLYYYDKYVSWCGFERWALQQSSHNPSHQQRGQKFLADNNISIPPQHLDLPVKHMGYRSSLSSCRKYPWSIFDWMTIPIAGFMFYVVPQFDAQICQLFTNSLEYKVAAKPQLQPKDSGVDLLANVSVSALPSSEPVLLASRHVQVDAIHTSNGTAHRHNQHEYRLEHNLLMKGRMGSHPSIPPIFAARMPSDNPCPVAASPVLPRNTMPLPSAITPTPGGLSGPAAPLMPAEKVVLITNPSPFGATVVNMDMDTVMIAEKKAAEVAATASPPVILATTNAATADPRTRALSVSHTHHHHHHHHHLPLHAAAALVSPLRARSPTSVTSPVSNSGVMRARMPSSEVVVVPPSVSDVLPPESAAVVSKVAGAGATTSMPPPLVRETWRSGTQIYGAYPVVPVTTRIAAVSLLDSAAVAGKIADASEFMTDANVGIDLV